MTDRLPLDPPPEWAIKEAVRRLASAAVGYQVALEDVRWRLGTYAADHVDPDGTVVRHANGHIFFGLASEPTKINSFDFAAAVGLAFAIAQQAN